MTNFEYEDAVNESVDFDKDPVIGAVFRNAWYLYDDVHKHRLRGEDALPGKARREVAKWLLFLYTDLEYRWPTLKQRLSAKLHKISLGSFGKPLPDGSGDEAVWPFFCQEEFAVTVSHPVDFKGPSGLRAATDTRSRLSRLLPYPVLWKIGITALAMTVWILLKWRSLQFDWSQLPALIACGVFSTIIMSLHDKKKFSDLKWWQVLLIFLAIILIVLVAPLILIYWTG